MGRTTSRSPLFYGWFIVGVTFFIAFLTVGARNVFGVFVTPMEDDFGWNRSTTSLAFMFATLVGGASQPFLGRVYDRLGGRKVILSGLGAIGVFTILLSLTFSIVYLVLIYGVVLAIAMSAGSTNTAGALLTKWFRRKRATVIALVAAGSSFGGLVLVPFAAYMMDLTSWRITWVVLGMFVLVLALPVAYLLLRDDPRDMGLSPDGDQEPSDMDPQGNEDSTPEAQTSQGPLEVDRWSDSFRSFPMWQLSGAYFVCGFTTSIISMHFVPFAEGEGFSRATAVTAFGVLSGLNAVGVIAVGFLADRFGRKNLLAAVYVVRACGFAVLLMAPGAWSLWGFAFLTGLSWVATIPLTTSLTADIYGLKTVGTLSGMAFFAHQIGGSISVLLAGIIYDVTASYLIPFSACGVLLVIASLTAFSIRERKYSIKYQTRPSLGISPTTM